MGELSERLAWIILWLRGWRPIATAPKDGTTLRLLTSHGFDCYVPVSTVGLWMAPSDEKSLIGWWLMGAHHSPQNKTGLPHDVRAIADHPFAWKPWQRHGLLERWALKFLNIAELKREARTDAALKARRDAGE